MATGGSEGKLNNGLIVLSKDELQKFESILIERSSQEINFIVIYF